MALAPLTEHMPRLLRLLDPGAAIRAATARPKWRSDRRAVPQREATPLHVRPAPADSGEVGA